MYYDYRTSDKRELSIPAKDFKVSTDRSWAIVSCLAGGIIVAISALVIAGSPIGSTTFWAATGFMAFGSASVIFGIFYPLYENRSHQRRMLHNASSLKEYLNILNEDHGANYSFYVPDFVHRHRQINEDLGVDHAGLITQTGVDFGRNNGTNIYYVNGKRCEELEKLQKILGDNFDLLNQSAISEMSSILNSRYQNSSLSIWIGNEPQKSPEKEPTIGMDSESSESSGEEPPLNLELVKKIQRYDIENGSVKITQLFAIRDMVNDGKCLKYIKGIMHIRLDSGEATIKWASPQNEKFPDLRTQ